MTALRFWSGKHFAAWLYPDHLLTMMPDGTSVKGYQLDTPEFKLSAAQLGYPDTFAHIVEHDLVHSLVAEHMFSRPSIALWNQAHNPSAWLEPMPEDAAKEEYIVGSIQAALNGVGWGLKRLRHQMRQEARFFVIDVRRIIRPDGKLPCRG